MEPSLLRPSALLLSPSCKRGHTRTGRWWAEEECRLAKQQTLKPLSPHPCRRERHPCCPRWLQCSAQRCSREGGGACAQGSLGARLRLLGAGPQSCQAEPPEGREAASAQGPAWTHRQFPSCHGVSPGSASPVLRRFCTCRCSSLSPTCKLWLT